MHYCHCRDDRTHLCERAGDVSYAGHEQYGQKWLINEPSYEMWKSVLDRRTVLVDLQGVGRRL